MVPDEKTSLSPILSGLSEKEKIYALFPSQKFKCISYPIRPLFTLCAAIVFTTLGWVGIFPFSVGVLLAMVITFDDFIMAPYFRISQSINNLLNNRKKDKSIVSLVAIVLGIAIIDGIMGYYILNHYE